MRCGARQGAWDIGLFVHGHQISQRQIDSKAGRWMQILYPQQCADVVGN